jgi:zinc transport system substrate-binding protein
MSESVAPDLRVPPSITKNDSHMRLSKPSIAMVAVAVAVASGCSKNSGPGSSQAGEGSDRPTVVTSFAPLAWAADRLAATAVDVIDLTPPGSEPHDLELSPSQIVAIGEAELAFVVGGGFQPAVEDAVADLGDDAVILLDRLDGGDPGERDPEAGDVDHDDGHQHGGIDPHVWLDPPLMIEVVEVMRAEITRRVPEAADRIAANAAALVLELETLDRDITETLEHCARRELVTAHDAFGRFASRYGLVAIPIAGISPDIEPSPSRLAEIAELARDLDVTTIFAESLVSPEVAQALATEAGGLEVARLDPVEGFTDEQRAAGVTYFDVMRENLAAIAAGLSCS